MRFMIALIVASPVLILIAFYGSAEYWNKIYFIWEIIYAFLSFIFNLSSLSPVKPPSMREPGKQR